MILNPFKKYFFKKVKWYIATLFIVITLNFLLPRIGSSNPVNTVLAQRELRLTDEQYHTAEIYYAEKFDLDKPLYIQYLNYLIKTVKLDLGESFVHDCSVWEILREAMPWTIALQLMSIISGFIFGNIIGAAAAYKRRVYDKLLYPASLFFMSIPYFCLGIILVYYLGIKMQIFPAMGGYAFDLNPGFNMKFTGSILYHFILPYTTLTLVFMGGNAISMRSMAIYELGAGYVKYAKALGAKDSQVLRYVFKNSMLPQLTNLALALGFAIGGSLLTEIVFSYPGIGMALYNAIKESDLPVIQSGVLIVTIIMLTMNLTIDLVTGIFDPRVRASQENEL